LQEATSTAGQAAPTRPNGSASGPSARPQPASSRSSATPGSSGSSPLELEERARAAEDDGSPGGNDEPEGQLSLDDQLARINELLGSPQEATDDEGAPDQPGAEKPASDPLRGADGKFKAKTLADLAERLDVDLEELYGLQLTTKGGGELVKLGDLKDAWQDRQQAVREIARRDSGLDEREAALRAEQALWEPVLRELNDKLPQEFKARLSSRDQQQLERERTRLLDAAPELADQTQFQAWRGEVVGFLAGYGYSPQEMAITDHRMLVILRDHMRLKARLEKLMAYEPGRDPPKPMRPQGRQPPQSRARHLVETARRSGREQDKLAAIAGLIDGT
jgi:hypothetical protein